MFHLLPKNKNKKTVLDFLKYDRKRNPKICPDYIKLKFKQSKKYRKENGFPILIPIPIHIHQNITQHAFCIQMEFSDLILLFGA